MDIINKNKVWESKEWEMHVNDLLRIKFGIADYIPIPDGHNGDAGIEGFWTGGYAFQAYCPDEACAIADLYEKQRDKITADIGKFIKNKDNSLGKIFHSIKISRWILVVPNHVSKNLTIHAAKKEQEVIEENLPYIDNEKFKILIWDRQALKSEENELISSGLRILKIDIPEVDGDEIEKIINENSEFVENIHKKLMKLKNNEKQVNNAASLLLNQVVCYKNIMSDLKENYPSFHQEISNTIINRENELRLDFFDTEVVPPNKQIALLNGMLSEASKLHRDNLKCISTGVIGDWLMRCNLDF